MKDDNTTSRSSVEHSSADGLLKVLSVNDNTPTRWRDTDAADMLRLQLDAALEFDLCPPHPTIASEKAKKQEIEAAQKAGIVTFRDLYLHASPPVGLLKMAKDFFKKIVQETPKDRPDNTVAHVCYYLSIAVARSRTGEQISNLSDAQLAQGLDWVAKRDWVEEPTKSILTACRPTGSC